METSNEQFIEWFLLRLKDHITTIEWNRFSPPPPSLLLVVSEWNFMEIPEICVSFNDFIKILSKSIF
jgi:hypothetical protein